MIMKSRLKELRESKGISKYRLAKDTGLNRPLLDKIEDGTVMELPVYAIIALCKYFKKPIQGVFYLEEVM
jgi:DNA-binding XRE family transcriptional regulator